MMTRKFDRSHAFLMTRFALALLLVTAVTSTALAQQPATAPPADPAAASPAQTTPPQTAPPPAPVKPQKAAKADRQPKMKPEQREEITEDQLKQELVGKPLLIRGGFLGDSLSFTQYGDPVGHMPVGSYTLSGVQIEKVHLSKKRIELEGARYASHYLGSVPTLDMPAGGAATDVDRVKITPKKKVLRIVIQREDDDKKGNPKRPVRQALPPQPATGPAPATAMTPNEVAEGAHETAPKSAVATEAENPPPAITPQAAPEPGQTAVAAAPAAANEAHGTATLRGALDRIFAPGIDDAMRAKLPDYWQLYFKGPKVLRTAPVDQPARLTSVINPQSNDYAQANQIAGRALYRVVVSEDGKPGEIAVLRPIGFGLDENAVAAIRKASFQPAMKGGQPAMQSVDLAVVFRIYSKRTAVAGEPATETDAQTPKAVLPGPYSAANPDKPQPPPQ